MNVVMLETVHTHTHTHTHGYVYLTYSFCNIKTNIKSHY